MALKVEMCELNIQKTAMAFCFLLRSAFEISAKAYANDNGISIVKINKKGDAQNKTLAELLKEIVDHLTSNGKNKGMGKRTAWSIDWNYQIRGYFIGYFHESVGTWTDILNTSR